MKFKTLDDAIDCYGREQLVPIDFIKQQLFYAKCGCQPKFIWEKEGASNKITCWYLKSETMYAKRKWDATRPTKKA